MDVFKGIIWGLLFTALGAVCLWLLIDIIIIFYWTYKMGVP